MQSLGEGLRQRKTVTKAFKELDAFPKVPENYQESSASGGTVSIMVFLLIGVLVMSECIYYSGTVMKYKYEVDKDADQKIQINIDLTIAMECDDVGADVLDLSGSSIDTSEHLKLVPTHFSMSTNQQQWWNAFSSARQSEEGYRTINDVTEMDRIFGPVMPTYMPEKSMSEFEGKDFDACRVFGNIEVNKVAGNFHLTAGKSIPHPRGHAHLSSMVSELNYNFSHRIDLLSFGEPHSGIINPLDGDLMTTEYNYYMYQYYIKIVPTTIKTLTRNLKTNQYSVTQRSRPIDHSSGSHGVPGVFFKYDLNAMSICVIEERRAFTQFLIRLCGIIGGVFATSGMLHAAIGGLADNILCKMRETRKERSTFIKTGTSVPVVKISEQTVSDVTLVQPDVNISNIPIVQ